MSHSINILSLSNDPQLAAVVQHRLEDEQIDVNMQTVDNRHAYQVALAGNHFDVILVDGTQDAVDGIEAIETAKRHSLDIPVIMLSDTLDEAMIVMAIKRGASDYVLKRNIEHIDTLIRQSLDECQMGYLGAAESRVNDAMETRYQDIVNSLPGAVYQFQKNIDRSAFPVSARSLNNWLASPLVTYMTTQMRFLNRFIRLICRRYWIRLKHLL